MFSGKRTSSNPIFLIDVDGTLTGLEGRHTVQSELYMSLLEDKEAYAGYHHPETHFLPPEARKEKMQEAFRKNTSDPMRLLDGAKAFLAEALANGCEIHLVSKNRKEYIETLLECGDFLTEAQRKGLIIHDIFELFAKGGKRGVAKNILKEKTPRFVGIFDDDSIDTLDMEVGVKGSGCEAILVSYTPEVGGFDKEYVYQLIKQKMEEKAKGEAEAKSESEAGPEEKKEDTEEREKQETDLIERAEAEAELKAANKRVISAAIIRLCEILDARKDDIIKDIKATSGCNAREADELYSKIKEVGWEIKNDQELCSGLFNNNDPAEKATLDRLLPILNKYVINTWPQVPQVEVRSSVSSQGSSRIYFSGVDFSNLVVIDFSPESAEIYDIRSRLCQELDKELQGLLKRKHVEQYDELKDESTQARYKVVESLRNKIEAMAVNAYVAAVTHNPDWKNAYHNGLRKEIKNSLHSNQLDKYGFLEKLGISLLNLLTVLFSPIKRYVTGSWFYSTQGKSKEAVIHTLEILENTFKKK